MLWREGWFALTSRPSPLFYIFLVPVKFESKTQLDVISLWDLRLSVCRGCQSQRYLNIKLEKFFLDCTFQSVNLRPSEGEFISYVDTFSEILNHPLPYQPHHVPLFRLTEHQILNFAAPATYFANVYLSV